MKPVTCLIVDDERLARQHLRRLASACADLEIAGEASSRADALRAVKELRPQLLLLDIQMPGGGGFHLLNDLEDPPAVIFVTAHDSHAIRAFEVNALDYLLKPVAPERFGKAIDRAVRMIRGEPGAGAPAPGPLETDDVALFEIGHSGHFVTVDSILCIESDGNYTRVTTADGARRITRQPVKEWARRLPAGRFVQLDRGTIVNRKQLKSVEFTGRSGRLAIGDRQIALTLGTAATERLREILES